MKLEIIDYIEDSDGGATVTLDLDESAKDLLIQRGFNSLLLDAIKKLERDYPQSPEEKKIKDHLKK